MTQTLPRTPVCRLDQIPDGRSKGVMPNRRGRDQVLLVRKGGDVFGYVNNCPHYDRAPMGWKKDEFLNGPGDRIMCSVHGALFRIEDGVCELGPCLGRSLSPVPIEIVDGQVVIAFDAETGDQAPA